MLGARRVADRYRDLSGELRDRVVGQLVSVDAPEHYVTLVRDGGKLESEEVSQVVGEALPLGLRVCG